MRSPLQLLFLVASLIFCLLFLSRANILGIVKYWQILLFVPTCLFAFHLFLHPGQELFRIGFLAVTQEGLTAASMHSLKLFCSISAVVIFLLTTDIKSLIVSLIQMRVPVRFAYSIYLMLRFVPIMTVEAETILMALRTRVPRKRSGSLWLLLWERYLVTLVLMGVRRAEQAALAMDARGFSLGSKTRTFLDAPRWDRTGMYFFTANLALSWGIKSLL